MKIKKVSNGYIIVAEERREEEIYTTLDEVFKRLLLYYEGRSDWFGVIGKKAYGVVKIFRKPYENFTSPPEKQPVQERKLR